MSSRVNQIARRRERARTREELDGLEVSRAANDAVQVVLGELDLLIVGWEHLAGCGGLTKKLEEDQAPSWCAACNFGVTPEECVPVYRVRGLESA